MPMLTRKRSIDAHILEQEKLISIIPAAIKEAELSRIGINSSLDLELEGMPKLIKYTCVNDRKLPQVRFCDTVNRKIVPGFGRWTRWITKAEPLNDVKKVKIMSTKKQPEPTEPDKAE